VSDITQLGILSALGYVVFEKVNEGAFRLCGEAPVWLKHFLPGDSRGIALADLFPFLEVFLLDAEEFWTDPGSRPRLQSDYWTQTGSQGKELPLCATALKVDKRSLLVIECVEEKFKGAQSQIDHAHEATLLKRELERATEAKSEFLARMSHEIRTPLNALLGMAELLAETTLNAEQSEYVRIFQRTGDTLLRVVNEVLDFSKVEAGQVEIENVAFELPLIIEEALEVMAVRANAKGLRLSRQRDATVPAVLMGDPARLRQVLLNLLGNAIKFTEQGEVRVRVFAENEMEKKLLHFVVSDTGIGIPADRLPTVFDSFTQAEASTTRKFGGTGLGLAISKKFVELMGGRIWVESTPGLGTQMHFTVRFAVGESVPQGASEVRSSVVLQKPKGTLRILLADDMADNRFLIRGYLKSTGYLIDEAENGAVAVEKFKEGAYDVVLIDCEMPVLDGFSATREMRAYEREHNVAATPILMLTAHAFKKVVQESVEAGCTGHLAKPIRKAALFEAIQPYERERLASTTLAESDESWLTPIIPGYLEKRRSDVGKLRNAIEKKDYGTVRMVGHQMAGTGASYGFEKLTELGSALEESADSGDEAEISAEIEELERYLAGLDLGGLPT